MPVKFKYVAEFSFPYDAWCIVFFIFQDLRELLSLPKQGFDVSLTQQQLHEEHGDQHNM